MTEGIIWLLGEFSGGKTYLSQLAFFLGRNVCSGGFIRWNYSGSSELPLQYQSRIVRKETNGGTLGQIILPNLIGKFSSAFIEANK